MRYTFVTALFATTLALSACHQSGQPSPAATASSEASVTRQQAPAAAKVSFVGIKDGDTVTSPFKVGFHVTGMVVAPAGSTEPDSGHFHLIIDSELPPQDAPLPANEHVKHYGKGQTEDTLSLPPGQHTLQIEFADVAHVPFNPPVVSDRITITVK